MRRPLDIECGIKNTNGLDLTARILRPQAQAVQCTPAKDLDCSLRPPDHNTAFTAPRVHILEDSSMTCDRTLDVNRYDA